MHARFLQRRRHARPGFSLLELLIIAAILAVLLGLFLPSLGRSRRQSERLADLSDEQQVAFKTLEAAGISIYSSYDDEISIQSGTHPMTLELYESAIILENVSHLCLTGAGLTDDDLSRLPPSETMCSMQFQLNEFTDEGLRHLAAFPNLTNVNLAWNTAHGECLQTIGGLPKIQHIDLSNTPCRTGLHYLRGADALRSLNLENTSIDDEALGKLPTLSQLGLLNLSGTAVTSAGIKSLPRLTSLSTLNMTGTSISNDALNHLAQLPNLRQLYLSHTVIDGRTFAELADSPQLNTLFLDGTGIDDASLDALQKCRHLQHLSLRETAITDDALPQLAAIPQLTHLDLSDCAVTSDGIRRLLTKRPLLNVVWSRNR